MICYIYLPNPPPSERSTPPQESCKSFHWCEPCQASHSTPSLRFPFKDLSKMNYQDWQKEKGELDDSFQFCQDKICAVLSKDILVTSKLISFWTLVTFSVLIFSTSLAQFPSKDLNLTSSSDFFWNYVTFLSYFSSQHVYHEFDWKQPVVHEGHKTWSLGLKT